MDVPMEIHFELLYKIDHNAIKIVPHSHPLMVAGYISGVNIPQVSAAMHKGLIVSVSLTKMCRQLTIVKERKWKDYPNY